MKNIVKYKHYLLIVIGALLVVTFSISYAYFDDLIGEKAETNVNITADTPTSLTFTKGEDILLNVNPVTLAEGGTNVTGSTTSSATLYVGEYETGAVTENYNVYFEIKNNTFVYTSPTNEAEILLSITDPNGTKVTISSLTEKTSGGVTGYDITTFSGMLKVKELEEITSETTITEEWTATITFVNLSTDQKDNMSKSLESSLIVQKEKYTSTDLILGHNGGKDFIEAKAEPDFTQIADTNEGMFATTDTYGTAYYYRGAVDNNWLYYNGIYWRIVSIAGNGSIKLLYSGTTAPTESEAVVMTGSGTEIVTNEFSSNFDDNAYVGYMYTIGERQGLETSSLAKINLESWYALNMISVDSQIDDNIFCYDRSLTTGGFQSEIMGYNGSGYTGDGLGTNFTLYGVAARITASSSILTAGGSGPKLLCPSKEDAYTVEDTTNGNGALDYKVGLITADEAIMAGLTISENNTINYLYTNRTYSTGSPFAYIKDFYAYVWNVSGIGKVHQYSVVTPLTKLRPIVYLSLDVDITGTGTWNDPYKVA